MTHDAPAEAPVRLALHEGGIAVLTLCRSNRLNALDLELKRLLAEQIERLGTDERVRVVILTGANGVFVAGTDIREMRDMSPQDHVRLRTGELFQVLRRSPKPLIAAVERFALGGGCELALACDLIIAGESAKFGQPEIRVGIMPGAGGTQLLLRTMGKYAAMKLLLTGQHLPAKDALALGLVSEVVPTGEALNRALELAREIASMPPLSIHAIREAVRLGQDLPLSTALEQERRAFQSLFASQDQKEGMDAFLEKRAPVFRGE